MGGKGSKRISLIEQEEILQEHLASYLLHFPAVLIQIIKTYCTVRRFPSTPDHIWELPEASNPTGIVSDRKYLYICIPEKKMIITSTLQGQKLEETTLGALTFPSNIELDQNQLFLRDETKITVMTLHKKIILNTLTRDNNIASRGRGFKLDGSYIYYTIFLRNDIFSMTREGRAVGTFGTPLKSNKKGEFDGPMGLTVDHKYLYICDMYNHRIQVISKDWGLYRRGWGTKGTQEGQFLFPLSIYYHPGGGWGGGKMSGMIFVGDHVSVQSFTTRGLFIQRFGDQIEGNGMLQFSYVESICLVEDSLYVCDGRNHRVKIYGLNKR